MKRFVAILMAAAMLLTVLAGCSGSTKPADTTPAADSSTAAAETESAAPSASAITWAKSYRYKNAMEAGKESWRAGWLYGLYEKIVGQLRAVWTPQTRFNEEERAQLFIGYLAAFPQKEKAEPDLNENEEEKEHG